MENRLTIPLLCIAAIVYACGPWRHSSNTNAATLAVSNTHKKIHNTIATTFNVNSSGNRVDFVISVANHTKKAVELRFPTSQTHDFAVLDSKGRTVWRWSSGRMFTQAMQSKVVKPKDTLTITNDWDASNAHGEYIAVATLNSGDLSIERRVPFRLP